MSSELGPAISVEDLSEQQKRARAERVQYLIKVHKVDTQVLSDLGSQYK